MAVCGAADSRTPGATKLVGLHSHASDCRIVFTEATHVYDVDGVRVPRSVTRVVSLAFSGREVVEFDKKGIIERNFMRWRDQGPSGEHWEYFERLCNGEWDERDVERAIVAKWDSAGPLGTEMHRVLEVHCDTHGDDWAGVSCIGPHTAPDDAILPELAQFDEWVSGETVQRLGLVPWRTELSTFYTHADGRVTCAGQIDLVARDKTGNYYIIDYKRIHPKYGLTASDRVFSDAVSAHLDGLGDTKYARISLQLSLYAVMLAQTHGWDCGDRLYLLRVHRDKHDGAQFTQCMDLREPAQKLLGAL